MSIARVLALVLAAAALAPAARATWSIVLVNPDTGEIGVASATCLEFENLKQFVPVLVVGKGGGVAQSQVDPSAKNRMKIWDGLHADVLPKDIIEGIKDDEIGGLLCSRQFGIVNLDRKASGFTGACAGDYNKNKAGGFGNYKYSVQGNVLTGAPVILEMEDAMENTPGNLADKLMAAMEAARAMGGDGRCSCAGAADACGAPPIPSLGKSAHVAFLTVARIGDTDGICNGAFGCANGDYWLDINIIGGAGDPEPVFTMQTRFDEFRLRMQGVPDGIESMHQWDDDTVLGIGGEIRTLDIALHDIDGLPVMESSDRITIEHAPGSAGLSPRQEVLDNGDGTYTIRVLAGQGTGTDLFQISFFDQGNRATLYPFPALDYVSPLEAGREALTGSRADRPPRR